MTGPTAVTLDELEANAASEGDQKPDLSKVNLEGDNIPDSLKGKSVEELLKHTANVTEALKLSEESRLTLRTSLDARPAAPVEPVPAAPTEPEVKPLSDEELATLFENEPLKAIRLMQDQAIAKVAGHYEKRLEPLFAGSATSAETLAKKNFPTEFELFGDEINGVIAKMPDKSGLTNPGTWEDIIAYVRGSKGNFERYMTHMTTKAAAAAATEAQNQQAEAVGFTPRPTAVLTVPQTVDQLDKTTLEIADKLGLTPEEYVKWGFGGGA